MLLSIIIPVYNAEKYLKECLDSVLEVKNDSKFEIILINDGSTDYSKEICDTYMSNNKEISVLHIKNNGVSNARNLGICQAKGEYILFLDADDYIMKDTLTDVISFLEIKAVELLLTDFIKFINTTGKSTYISLNIQPSHTVEEIVKLSMESRMLNSCCGKIYKKDIILNHNISFNNDLKIGEDFCFVNDYINYISKIDYISLPLFSYRVHKSSTMRKTHYSQRLIDMEYIYNKRLAIINKCKFDNNVIQKMNAFYFSAILWVLIQECNHSGLNEKILTLEQFYVNSFVCQVINDVQYKRLNLPKRVFLFFIRNRSRYFIVFLGTIIFPLMGK